MSNGLLPGPANGPGSPDIDEGTLPRAGTPPPGSIGLDTKGGSKGTPQQSLSDRVLAFARQRIGQVQGDGECFTLADDALRNAGAKSAADFGKVGPDIDYVWGQAVTRAGLQPGDIIQMRDYRADITTDTDNPDGSARQRHALGGAAAPYGHRGVGRHRRQGDGARAELPRRQRRDPQRPPPHQQHVVVRGHDDAGHRLREALVLSPAGALMAPSGG